METRILVVDDIEENLYSLKEFLKEHLENLDIVFAQDGEDALHKAIHNDIDLILLDIQMPKMDGFEVAKYLNLHPKTKDIPVIFLTAVFKEEEFIKKGFDLGAIDYIIKPLDSQKLLEQKHIYKKLIDIGKTKKLLEQKVQEETLKRLQQERITMCQSKMATMGEMMANISHQWRQPLAAITNLVDYVKLMSELENLTKDELSKNLDNIAEITIFLSNTIDTFRRFFRGDNEASEFTVDEVVKDVLAIINKTIDINHINLVLDCDDIVCFGLKNELEQAILNIINNAKDVLIEKSKDKEKIIMVRACDDCEVTTIDIIDNGGGIKEDVLPKIFEPYFTTKHQSQGTGIGLYMTYQIIVDHFKGNISAHNTTFEYQGKEYFGAKFSISIPSKNTRCNNYLLGERLCAKPTCTRSCKHH